MSGKGQKGRKIGKGIHKAQHSRFANYAGIFAHSERKKTERGKARGERLAALRQKRKCKVCAQVGFSTRRAVRRHEKFGHQVVQSITGEANV